MNKRRQLTTEDRFFLKAETMEHLDVCHIGRYAHQKTIASRLVEIENNKYGTERTDLSQTRCGDLTGPIYHNGNKKAVYLYPSR